ncbi:hypothetical protein OXX80_008407 [Metschnikowia pulcherrima]
MTMSLISALEVMETTFCHISEAFTRFPKIGALVWFAITLTIVFPVALVKRKTHASNRVHTQKQQDLFPSIEKAAANDKAPEEPLVEAFPQPCSTGLTTRLLPFKNAKGEIEWVFTDDVQPGQELEAFKASPGTFKATPPPSKNTRVEKPVEILSPVTSNSSNNESLSGKKSESSVSPQVNTPSSSSSEDHKDDDLEDRDGDISGEGENGNQIHECPHCDAKFRMRGYLTRHLKKHMPQKAYRCPFREISIYIDENDNTHQCHPSGGFSRRDTYKTHLKTRHFKFPAGTPIKGRNQSPGNCSMCGEWFQNAEIWSEIHVEGGECKFLPAGFQGKSRIKNKLKKQMARLLKEEKKYKSRSKKLASLEYLSPGTGSSNIANTPSMSMHSQYEYDDSPTQSSCSSVGPLRSVPLQDQFSRDMHHRSTFTNSPMSDHNLMMSPNTQLDDYDDEFCLDTDQMSIPVQNLALSPPMLSSSSYSPTPDYSIPLPRDHMVYTGFSR